MQKFWKTAVMAAVGPLDTGVAMMLCAHLIRLVRNEDVDIESQ